MSEIKDREIENKSIGLEDMHRQMFGKFTQDKTKKGHLNTNCGFEIFSLYRPAKLIYSSSVEQ